MNWFILTIVSYLMLALVNLGDKFIVDKLLKNSKTYVFVVCILGGLVILLAPWFLNWPGFSFFIVNMLAGFLFALALWSMYEALKNGETTRVTVVIGSIIPVFTIFFSLFFLKEKFSINQWLGVLFLIIGMIIISFVVSRRKKWYDFFKRLGSVFCGSYDKKWIFLAILSAFLYALYFITTKYAYSRQDFLSSFIWIKSGSALLVLLFLFDKKTRIEIKQNFTAKPKKIKKTKKGFVFINQFIGALASFMQSYAVYLGPVAIINALQGVQYAFLLILGIVFSKFFPKILKEDICKKTLIKKIIAIISVAIGLYFMSV
jgi:drug/metabolite transporter (DMT)-like permease